MEPYTTVPASLGPGFRTSLTICCDAAAANVLACGWAGYGLYEPGPRHARRPGAPGGPQITCVRASSPAPARRPAARRSIVLAAAVSLGFGLVAPQAERVPRLCGAARTEGASTRGRARHVKRRSTRRVHGWRAANRHPRPLCCTSQTPHTWMHTGQRQGLAAHGPIWAPPVAGCEPPSQVPSPGHMPAAGCERREAEVPVVAGAAANDSGRGASGNHCSEEEWRGAQRARRGGADARPGRARHRSVSPSASWARLCRVLCVRRRRGWCVHSAAEGRVAGNAGGRGAASLRPQTIVHAIFEALKVVLDDQLAL